MFYYKTEIRIFVEKKMVNDPKSKHLCVKQNMDIDLFVIEESVHNRKFYINMSTL